MDSCVIPNKSQKLLDQELTEYAIAPLLIATEIKDLTSSQLNHHIAPSEWNIRQVVVHLADTEMFFCERMKRIIAEEKPQLQSFDQDVWAKNLSYDKQSYELAFSLLELQRSYTIVLLRQLPSEAWIREGVRDGKVFTLYDIFATALHHIPTHLNQIKNIKNHPSFP